MTMENIMIINKLDELMQHIHGREGHEMDFDCEIKNVKILDYKFETFERKEMLVVYSLSEIGLEVIQPMMVAYGDKSKYQQFMIEVSGAFTWEPYELVHLIGLRGKVTLKTEMDDENQRLTVLKFELDESEYSCY